MPNLFTLVLQIAVILAVCRLVGTLFQKIHQPRVVGEMFAGIMLGPSVLGWIAPQISAYLFPPSSLGFLNALSQVGVVIFMFLVGLALHPQGTQGARARRPAGISRDAVRGFTASISASTRRLKAIAAVRAPTMQTMIQPSTRSGGHPPAASTAPVQSKRERKD